MLTKKHQPKNAPGKSKRDRHIFSIKIREDNSMSFYEWTVSKIPTLLGGISLFAGGLVLLFAGVYALTMWWRIIPHFGFWGFMGSVILFPITIPLTPIYLGVKGDWEPTGVFIFGMILGFLLIVIGGRLYKLNLFRGGSPHR